MFFQFGGKKTCFFAILYWAGRSENCNVKHIELRRPPPQNCRNALNTSWQKGPGLEQPWDHSRGRPVTLIISSGRKLTKIDVFDPPPQISLGIYDYKAYNHKV